MKTFVLSLLVVFGLLGSNAAAQSGIKFEPASGVGDPVANVDCSGSNASSPVCQDLSKTGNPLFGPKGVITRVANLFGVVVGLISVFMIILGGLRYVQSAGDSTKTNNAKNTILYAAIGLGVASLAGVIAQFILRNLSS